MKGTSITAVLATLALLVTGCENSTQATFDPPQDTLASASSGAGLYLYHCAACHGPDGRPTGAAVTDLRDYRGTFGAFDSILTDGPGTMPKFPHLNAAARQLLYEHVRRFSR